MTTKSGRRTPEPSKIRTHRDWVMIALGVFLTLLLLTLGYLSLGGPDSNPVPRKRGPVKNPKPASMLPGREDILETYPQMARRKDEGGRMKDEISLSAYICVICGQTSSLSSPPSSFLRVFVV